MKKTEILKQSWELSNDFNNEVFISSLKSQIGSLAFKELINGEKHSLTLEVRVLVNEEEREDVDPRLADLIDCVELFKKILKDSPDGDADPIHIALKAGNIDLFEAWRKSMGINTLKY